MTGTTPLVSVVIPAFNGERTIADAINSALAQNEVDLEVIVVDDGSQDGTAAIVTDIDDPRLRLVTQENRGVAAARNAGVERARGDWVAFLDCDDVWLRHKLQRQLQLMSTAPGCSASLASAYFVDDQLRPQKLRRCVPVDNPLLAFLRFQNLPASSSSWIVKRALLNTIGGFDSSLARIEDWDFSIRLARLTVPLFIDEPLTLYRVHANNRSHDIDEHIAPGLTILGRLFSDPTLAPEIKAHEGEIYARFYTMICGGMFRVGRWRGCTYWGMRALVNDPSMLSYIFATPLRRAQRRAAARGFRSAAQ
jgi:glycosyltransferase involved in cell wall biosynthesis